MIYKVFKRFVCNELLKKGYKLLYVEADEKTNNKTIFCFEKTDDIHNVVLRIKNEQK